MNAVFSALTAYAQSALVLARRQNCFATLGFLGTGCIRFCLRRCYCANIAARVASGITSEARVARLFEDPLPPAPPGSNRGLAFQVTL